ncbi:MAG: peroxiredoxin [Rhodoferax sp.]|nr:peroxiredoxin [Rhodoferax sp.]
MGTWSKMLAAAVLVLGNAGVHAALDVGEVAPQFTAQAALAGTVIRYSLAEQLQKGPVVLYFFPLAFSADCSIEANKFAEAIEDYRALGASVIGVSRDDIETQKKFSVSECRGKFAVAADVDQSIMKSYDAVLFFRSEYANRVSFVISPQGKVIYHFKSLNPAKHVENTLRALKSWREFGMVR